MNLHIMPSFVISQVILHIMGCIMPMPIMPIMGFIIPIIIGFIIMGFMPIIGIIIGMGMWPIMLCMPPIIGPWLIIGFIIGCIAWLLGMRASYAPCSKGQVCARDGFV